jgi:hypothetical protein
MHRGKKFTRGQFFTIKKNPKNPKPQEKNPEATQKRT